MSHVTHPRLHPAGWVRAHRLIALAALLALLATAAVMLVPTIGGNSSISSVADHPAPAVRSGPDESVVAAAVGSQPSVIRPDESRIAAAIGSASEGSISPTRPDESTVASAIYGR